MQDLKPRTAEQKSQEFVTRRQLGDDRFIEVIADCGTKVLLNVGEIGTVFPQPGFVLIKTKLNKDGTDIRVSTKATYEQVMSAMFD